MGLSFGNGQVSYSERKNEITQTIKATKMNELEEDLIKNIWQEIPTNNNPKVVLKVVKQLEESKKKLWRNRFWGLSSVLLLCLIVIFWNDFSLYEALSGLYDSVALSYGWVEILIVEWLF